MLGHRCPWHGTLGRAAAGERGQFGGSAADLAQELGPLLERRVGCGRLRVCVLGRARQLRLGDDTGEQKLHRRCRPREVLERIDGGRQIAEWREGHIRKQLLPCGDVVVVVELQDVGLELLDLRLAALGRRAGVHHPALDRGRRHDLLQAREHLLMKPLVGVDAGNALAKRLARPSGQDPEGVGAGVLGRIPYRQGPHLGQAQERVVGAARERNAGQRLLRARDQTRIRLGVLPDLGQKIEKRRAVAGQPLDLGRGEAFGLGPVDDPEPGFDQITVEFGPIGHHEVDLEPLKHEVRIPDPRPQVLLDTQHEPRQEEALEAAPVGGLRRAAQGVAGRETKPQRHRRGSSCRQAVQQIERAQDGRQRHVRCNEFGLRERLDFDARLLQRHAERERFVAALEVANAPDRGGADHHDRGRRPGGTLKPALTPLARRVTGDQPGLGKHDLTQQPGQEEAAIAVARGRRRGLETEARRHRLHQAIDRRAFLGAARDVEAAQEDRCREAALVKDPLGELDEPGFQGGKLTGKAEDERPALEIALSVEAGQHALLETGHQAVELLVEHPARRGLGARRIDRQGEAQDLLALALGEIGEELVEAGNQIALGHEQIGGEAKPERARQLIQPAADRARVLGSSAGSARSRSSAGKAIRTPLIARRRRCFFKRSRKPCQAARSASAWLSWVV